MGDPKACDKLVYRRGAFGCHRNHVVWQATPHYIIWTIWREKERNRRTFETVNFV